MGQLVLSASTMIVFQDMVNKYFYSNITIEGEKLFNAKGEMINYKVATKGKRYRLEIK